MTDRIFSLLVVTLLAGCSSSSNVAGAGDAGTTNDANASDAGNTPDPDAGTGTGGSQCTSARDQLLPPVDKVSEGAVSVVSDSDGVKQIYIDATANGQAATNPRVYVDLATGTRVDLTDKAATSSKDWDLAFKREIIFTNSGDAGPGAGGAAVLSKPFASVTTSDLASADIAPEAFFGEECAPKTDATGAPLTTFTDWYDYNMNAGHRVTPKANRTYLVRGGTGRTYKVGIKAYNALPDGGSRSPDAKGFYLLEVSAMSVSELAAP